MINIIKVAAGYCKRKWVLLTNRNSKFGIGLKIDFKTKLDLRGNKLIVGNEVHLRSDGHGYHAGMPFPTTILLDSDKAECVIGDSCRINGAYIHAKKFIRIGARCVIASGTTIIDSNGHRLLSNDRTVGVDEPNGIIIEDNVWVGLNVVILKGSRIGINSVIAAGSVVKGCFPPNSLIQGNPAKLVKILEIPD